MVILRASHPGVWLQTAATVLVFTSACTETDMRSECSSDDACPGGQTCRFHTCTEVVCASGELRCGEVCVDPASDLAFCGGCGGCAEVPGAEATGCTEGVCTYACTAGDDAERCPPAHCLGSLTEAPSHARTFFVDADGDGFGDGTLPELRSCVRPEGYAPDSGDCRDDDPDISPAAEERCDGIDNDCDGVSDGNGAVDPTIWYLDSDGDGFGSESGPTVTACDRPGDHTDSPGDCDDTDRTIKPGATERCDGVDNNCDGTVDEASASDADTYYLDSDGDTFGGQDSMRSCVPVDGYVLRSGDCDDGNANVNPDAEEICRDHIDNNCDASPNTCGITGEITETTYLGAERDVSSITTCDLNADGVEDLVVGDADLIPYHHGKVEVFFGPIAQGMDLSTAVPNASVVSESATGDMALVGMALDCGSDATGDGSADLLIGAPRVNDADSLVLLFNGADLGVNQEIWDAAWLVTDRTGKSFGYEVRLGPHLNNDAFADVLISSWDGEILAAMGPLDGPKLYSDLVQLDSQAVGFGSSIDFCGDSDGDGIDEVVVGDSGQPGGFGGGAHFFSGVGPFPFPIAQAITVTLNDEGVAGAAHTVLASDDLSGDGHPDLVVSAPWASFDDATRGRVFLVEDSGESLFLGPGEEMFTTERLDDTLRGVYLTTGDVNGDGAEDLLVGARIEDHAGVYIVYGPVGVTDAIDAVLISDSVEVFRGLEATDLDGDGFDEVIVATVHGLTIWRGGGM